MRRDLRIPEDLSCAFLQVIVPTRPSSLAGSFVVNRRKFNSVKHPSPFTDLLPLNICGNGNDQGPGLLSAAQHEIMRPFKRRFDLLGEPLR